MSEPTATTANGSNGMNGSQQNDEGGASTDTPRELSGAEKKKLAKAEKAARRAKEKGPAPAPAPTPKVSEKKTANVPSGSRAPQPSRDQGQSSQSRRGSVAAPLQAQSLPHRRRPSQGALPLPPKHDKPASFLAHLDTQQKRNGLEGTAKEVHPAIAALALHISTYTICGSHARCVAMLQALKAVIQSYTTPHGASLPRNLTSHYLPPQLAHIKSARPFSVSQSNAIRWLKNLIANIDPSVPETTAKNQLCVEIDTFINERFTVADQVICDIAVKEMRHGDVIVVYGKSAVVESVLLTAVNAGLNFTVLVVDSRPLFEGKAFARRLAAAGLAISYALTSSLSYAMKGATKCLLGAHAVYGNGQLHSRIGTALVAMVAKQQRVPVIVCAESIKFTDKVALDSIAINELAPEDELTLDSHSEKGERKSMKEMKTSGKLHLMNLLYDVTPPNLIDMIITEQGKFPPSSAPAVQRISAGT